MENMKKQERTRKKIMETALVVIVTLLTLLIIDITTEHSYNKNCQMIYQSECEACKKQGLGYRLNGGGCCEPPRGSCLNTTKEQACEHEVPKICQVSRR